MAHVDRERGQLILVTGLLVAVAMVVLVLLLNTAIFAENLASRGADPSGSEAIEYRATVVDGVGGLIDAENQRDFATHEALASSILTGIDRFDNRSARNYASQTTVVLIDESSITLVNGTLIRQPNSSRPFVNASGTPDWRLATGVDGARQFEMTVNESQLVSSNAGSALTDGAFTINVSNGGDVWRAFVYEESGEIVVAQKVGSDSTTRVCSASGPEATIDLTEGTIDGESCPGLSWADGVPIGYDIEFDHGENVRGTYEVTIDTSGGGSVDGIHVNTGPPNSPYAVPAVYEATFDVWYESPTLAYRAQVRVAPGEPP